MPNNQNKVEKEKSEVVTLLKEILDKIDNIDSEIYSLKHALTCKDC